MKPRNSSLRQLDLKQDTANLQHKHTHNMDRIDWNQLKKGESGFIQLPSNSSHVLGYVTDEDMTITNDDGLLAITRY
jgi:hypothetical protein